MKFGIALLLLLAASATFAVSVISPVSTPIEQGTVIEMGDAGPGQTFPVVVDPKATTGGRHGTGGAYDQMVASSLPEGWTSNPSQLYGTPLQVDITIPKDAADGQYESTLTLWDEAGASGLGDNVSFTVKVTVRKDIMDMKVEPASQTVGAGQPARYAITIVNKGIANDIYTIASSGVRSWVFQRSVYIPSGTSKTINYEVVGDEEAAYRVKIFAQSSSSEQISAEREVKLEVRSDLFSDYKAVNRGVLLFPLTEAPVYFVVGLLSNLIP